MFCSCGSVAGLLDSLVAHVMHVLQVHDSFEHMISSAGRIKGGSPATFLKDNTVEWSGWGPLHDYKHILCPFGCNFENVCKYRSSSELFVDAYVVHSQSKVT